MHSLATHGDRDGRPARRPPERHSAMRLRRNYTRPERVIAGRAKVLAVMVGLGLVLMFAAPAAPTSTPVVSMPSPTPTPATPTPAATATPTLGQFDAQIGTVTMQTGQTVFVLNSGAMDPSRCAGQQISIYGAGGVTLVGRQRPGMTDSRPAPLTTQIVSCSGAKHGTVALPAGMGVQNSPVRWGTDVSGPINALIKSGVAVSLPANATGYAKDSITPISGTSIAGNNARILNGFQAGYSAQHPKGLNSIFIVGQSHTQRLSNISIHDLYIDAGLDFAWNQLGNGEPMGILVTYAQQVTLSRDHINNTLRGIGVMEDADTVLLDSNVYTNNHEDGEHFGESYLPGDAVTNVSSQYALLNGYSDDGIAVVGGNLACTTNLSAPGGPVSNVTIVHPTIVGSQNPGGSGIYNCAIQIAGNAKNVSVIGASITQPGACSFQIVDFFGAAPHHVTIAGGHAEYGRTWGAAPILISGEGGPTNRFWPGCPVAPITDVTVSGMDLDMGANAAIHRRIGAPYYYSGVAGACFSAVGYLSQINLSGNSCHNDAGAKSNFGLYLDPDTFHAVPVGVTLSGNTFDFADTSSTLLYNGTNGAVVNENKIVRVAH